LNCLSRWFIAGQTWWLIVDKPLETSGCLFFFGMGLPSTMAVFYKGGVQGLQNKDTFQYSYLYSGHHQFIYFVFFIVTEQLISLMLQ